MPESSRYTPGRVAALAMIPVLCGLIFIAGKWGRADAQSRPAILQLEAWQAGQRHLTDADWERHALNLQRAARLDPDNPEILQWLGLAVEGRYISYAPNYPYAVEQRRMAVDYYRRSIRLRQTWPHAWAYLALVKYRLDEIDAEFYQAMHMAVFHAPHLPGIQNVISELGILLWRVLPEPERLFILEVMRDGLSNADTGRTRRLMDLIRDRGFLQTSCPLFMENVEFQEYCKENM